MGKEYVGKAIYMSLFFERGGLMSGERMNALRWSSGQVCGEGGRGHRGVAGMG
jgi:hypothetical protein